jgi:hypothetical protein
VAFEQKYISGQRHWCEPSYFRGRDQEDSRLKPAQVKERKKLYLKNTQHKKG